MRAMMLQQIASLENNPEPLQAVEVDPPEPGTGEILLRIQVCGVCHTELDEIEGRTPPPSLPVIPGHQAIGRVAAVGKDVTGFAVGDRLGVAWIFSACGTCAYCRSGRENLCADFIATGRDVNGGYAEFMTVPAAYAHRIPDTFSGAEAAPLLCAGAIGYRSLRLAGLQHGGTLGLTGFGASAHLVLKMVRYAYPETRVFVFARSARERAFSLELGAAWAGDTADRSPVRLDCIIDTTPVWKPVVEALVNLAPGGRLVINAIRKESVDQDYLLQLQYPVHLWEEKEIKSVANVTREDVSQFLELAATMQLRPAIQEYALGDANRALRDLKAGDLRGAKVLHIA